jgi:hypothetical protein
LLSPFKRGPDVYHVWAFLFECGRRLVMRSLWFVFLAFLGAGGITAQETNTYYPLKVGNRWDYHYSSFDWWTLKGYSYSFSVQVLRDSLFPNGKRYSVLSQWDISDGRFLRADSAHIYYYREYDSADVPFYNLEASPEEEWSAGFLSAGTVALDRVDTVTLFGRTTRVLTFRLDGLMRQYTSFSDKFGPVGYQSPGEPPGTEDIQIELLGCIVSDTLYGRLTEVGRDGTTPTNLKLFQNYPNPFNPATTVRYIVPEKGWVHLHVCDILGRKIRQLCDEQAYAGAYEIVWDGRDEQGHQVASGVYLYQLQFHSSTNRPPVLLTGKMILLR